MCVWGWLQHKATHMTIMCKDCKSIRVLACKPGMGGVLIPRNCDNSAQAVAVGQEPCSLDPFVVLPARSKYVDQQTLKMQVGLPCRPAWWSAWGWPVRLSSRMRQVPA